VSDKLGKSFISWARNERTIRALVLIGSRARAKSVCGSADEYSDWDFQIVTTHPSLFAAPTWVESAGLSEPLSYANRVGRLGHSKKISAIFSDGEIDIVLLPLVPLFLAKLIFRFGLGPALVRADQRAADLALIVRSGHYVVKGSPSWKAFFRSVASQVVEPKLSDAALRDLAEAFVCDYVSTQQKLKRGELLAAQRWLHCNLGEANFRLLHELRLRTGEPSFPDARRIENLGDEWRQAVTISALPEYKSLYGAVECAAHTFRDLMRALVGTRWKWPHLPSRLRAE
jgi:hypothetical protein